MLEFLFAVVAILVFFNWLTGGALEDDHSIVSSSSSSPSNPASMRPSLDLGTVDTITLRKAAKELGIRITDQTSRSILIRRIKKEVEGGGVSHTLRKKARSSGKSKSTQLSSGNQPGKEKSSDQNGNLRKEALGNHNFYDSVCMDCGLTSYEVANDLVTECKERFRPGQSSNPARIPNSPPMNKLQKLSLSEFILPDSSDSELRRVIGNTNSHLVALRDAVGNQKYGRLASIRLTGEAIVAFKMASQLLDQNQTRASASNFSLQRAERKVESLRDDLYEENEQVFEPYFENEPGVVDLDLSLLRRASQQAASGDETALSQIEYMFAYYHAVLGMYYGWQSCVLSGMSVSEAASEVSGTTDGKLHPPALKTLTAHFGAVLVKQHPDGVGKFEPLYAPPSH